MKSTILLCLLFLSTGCAKLASGTPADAQSLIVFAAVTLTDAFTELGTSYAATHPGVTVTFNFAGSQALRTQIEEGARADVFASANAREMDALIRSGSVDPGAPQIFLSNQLVVILPADNPAVLQTLEDLAAPGLKLVLAAAEVPVGNYARQSLDLMDAEFGPGFKEKVLANVVSNEDNVRQVVAKVQLGEADGGIVYMSDAVAAPGLMQIWIPDELNIIARFPIAALSDSGNPGQAIEFIDYVLSPQGQSVLQKWGFLNP
jgi:molybdate transport system substrate-binding protein